MAVVVTVALVGYVKLNQSINTFSSQGISKHRPPPTVQGQNILLIGSDTRAGADSALGGAGMAVGRSDTTLLLHVYEGGTRAVAVSIPRDALVDIPSCRLPDGTWSAPQSNAMFNSAFSVGQTATGNPACTVNTVEKLTGLRVDHTVVADFAGFAAMTKIVGGVPVCLPEPIYQGDINPNLGYQGKMVFHRGRQTVEGAKALDFVRLRHGIGDGSDIGRMRRQQAFLGAVVSKVRAQGVTPTHILPLAEAATKYFTFDPGLDSAQQLASFALSLRNMSTKDITFLTAPWRYDGPRVALVHPDVDQLWSALKHDQPLTSAGKKKSAKKVTTVAERLATVKSSITVANGTTVPGLAAQTAQTLGNAGVTVGTVTNASPESHTVIEYGPGETAQARALATGFVGAQLRTQSQPGLTVVLGAHHTMRSLTSTPSGKAAPLPDSITKETRSAATNPCTNVTYGAAGP